MQRRGPSKIEKGSNTTGAIRTGSEKGRQGGCEVGSFKKKIQDKTRYEPENQLRLRLCLWVCVCVCVWVCIGRHISGTYRVHSTRRGGARGKRIENRKRKRKCRTNQINCVSHIKRATDAHAGDEEEEEKKKIIKPGARVEDHKTQRAAEQRQWKKKRRKKGKN